MTRTSVPEAAAAEVEVTPTGDNTEYFYIDSVEVTNDEGDDWSKSNPPEAEIRIGLEDEDEYTFSGSSSSNFKLTLASSIKSRYDKVEYVSCKKNRRRRYHHPEHPPCI